VFLRENHQSRLQKRAKSLHALESDDEERDVDDEMGHDSEEDDFVEESDEVQRQKIRAAVAGRRAMVEQDAALKELQELFGDDYFGLGEEDAMVVDDLAAKPPKPDSELYEPSIMAEHMRTSKDLVVLATDMPERLQPHFVVNGEPILKPTSDEISREVTWIMLQPPFDERRDKVINPSTCLLFTLKNIFLDKIDLQQALNDVLYQFRVEYKEIPFLWNYRRYIFPVKEKFSDAYVSLAKKRLFRWRSHPERALERV